MDSLRLFYALWPDEDTRAALQCLQARVHGRMTQYENLHITLTFLGQQPEEKLPLLKDILAGLPRAAITLPIDRLGYFRKNRIAWAGMHAVPDELFALQTKLVQTLERHDIAFENHGRFKPHVTLARDAAPPLDAPFEPIDWQATQAALIHSAQEEGRLIYRVLASRSLDASP